MRACPFQVPTYEWSQPLPRVRKCDMCYERQLAGQLPACVEACPTGATLCGERDDLIAEAERRVAENSDQYHGLYGVMQAGGTSLLFVTAVPYEKLCLQRPLPPPPPPPAALRAHLADAGSRAGHRCGGRVAAGRHLVDHAPPQRGGRRGSPGGRGQG